jgi:hypothetical protein
MREYGIPEEILSDNGKQFTDRFGKGGRCGSTGSAGTTASSTG